MSEITLGEILTSSPQYGALIIVIWGVAKLNPVLIKLAAQIERMNDRGGKQDELCERMLRKLEEKP